MTKNLKTIEEFAKILSQSSYVVFFTGAGVSTESGLKSFRGKDGLYSSRYLGKYQPEEILSHNFFFQHSDIFLQYIQEVLCIDNIQANKGHKALAKLEELGLVKSVITQNIDDLHQSAGSKSVIELHGSLKRWYCISCSKHYASHQSCDCGGVVRPDVTLYGEMLDENATQAAIREIERADTLVIAGTSLTVYPAAYYIQYFQGKHLIILNKEETQYDSRAELCIRDNFAEVMEQALKLMKV